MLQKFHLAAGMLAMLCVALFWGATAAAELWLGPAAVIAVKEAVVAGLFVLVPTMAAVGMSGARLARSFPSARLTTAKTTRMRLLAANGVLAMIPAALYLQAKASAGEFDVRFYAVQAVELVVGAAQLILMGLNLRDGLRLSRRLPTRRASDA